MNNAHISKTFATLRRQRDNEMYATVHEKNKLKTKANSNEE